MTKRLNEMTELRDLGKLTTLVHLGASTNIVVTILLTLKVFSWVDGAWAYALPWAVLLPVLNLAPVLMLRARGLSEREFPLTNEMDFFRDQHRFSSWVYAVAAANMFLWIMTSWWLFSFSAGIPTVVAICVFAAAVTFVPLWRRFHPSFRGESH